MTDSEDWRIHESGTSGRSTGGATSYILDNAWEQERERLAAGAAWLDPWTITQLVDIGVAKGWACLEAGAGGGSITEWLCSRVGDGGRVLATDVDPRFVEVLSYPNLEVRRHDITTDGLPHEAFDLVTRGCSWDTSLAVMRC